MTVRNVVLAALWASVAAITMIATGADAITRKAEPMEGLAPPVPYSLSTDCTLTHYNACSCWTWAMGDVPNSEWGEIFSPQDCVGGCASGGSVTDVWFMSKCVTPPPRPRNIGGVMVHSVDAVGCRTALIWSSGPLTITHCTSNDGWTHLTIPVGAAMVAGNAFAISIKWGSTTYGMPPDTNFRLLTDDGISNLYCSRGITGNPGCEATGCTCSGWAGAIPPQRSYIYVDDINGDGVVDDICALRGAPYSLAFPYVAHYGYMPNNLLIQVGLDCTHPTSVNGTLNVPGSWGHIKALFE